MFYDILQSARTILSLLLAYVFSVTVSGAIKAWTAKKAGDYTADHAGFLSLDPLVHIDAWGMIMMLLIGFGWGRKVPVNPHNIGAPYRDLKILSVYYIQMFLHLLLAVLAIMVAAGQKALAIYMGESVILGAILLITAALFHINIFLVVLNFIQNSIDLICLHLVDQNPGLEIYIDLGSLLVTLILLHTLGAQIHGFFTHFSLFIASFFLPFLG